MIISFSTAIFALATNMVKNQTKDNILKKRQIFFQTKDNKFAFAGKYC